MTKSGFFSSFDDVWMLDGVRTPMVDYCGALGHISPTDLGIKVGREVLARNGVPGEHTIQNGDFITMDFGARVKGYLSDMTRTVAMGSVSDEMEAVYQLVLKAQLAALAAAFLHEDRGAAPLLAIMASVAAGSILCTLWVIWRERRLMGR